MDSVVAPDSVCWDGPDDDNKYSLLCYFCSRVVCMTKEEGEEKKERGGGGKEEVGWRIFMLRYWTDRDKMINSSYTMDMYRKFVTVRN